MWHPREFAELWLWGPDGFGGSNGKSDGDGKGGDDDTGGDDGHGSEDDIRGDDIMSQFDNAVP